ncbi:MAG TPA: nucleoside kinase [Thermoclostridium caenicola]|uniref:nucleoside kinase n=1 Tax=Thermoclostridium caenicola TaxID=659425 RepID=UPI002CB7AA69|nr:nucleoside kinase [Thermoclostridium caenicola]HOL85035.1 nucleoside kinase [Thermoclostridium caenicola]HPO76804.1 nucleoside kinase [Thermoclostridium caenicola]
MSNQGIRIRLNGQEMEVARGTRIEELVRDLKGKMGSQIVAAVVNNEIRELTFPIEQESDITTVDLSSDDGIRIYQRSLKFLLIKAVHDLFPDKEVQVRHSVRRGVFFEIVDYKVTPEDVERLEKRMRELVEQDHRFVKRVVPIDEARRIFLSRGREDRYRALAFREKDYVSLYTFDDIEDYFYGYMVPSTGYLKLFGLAAENDGIVLIVPKKENPTRLPDVTLPKQLFDVFTEYTNWIKILGVEDVGRLNEVVKKGRIHEFILISEALHEKKIAQIADMILQQKKRIILIAGPSSSGKTTFARRLGIQLRVNGLRPLNISVDDYFVDKTQTPLDEDGKPDYEALETVDLAFFNQSMNALLKGEEIDVPTFNFVTGKREFNGRKMKLEDGCVVIIEGIHALNPRLTNDIDDADKFKIYISAITSMRIDQHNRIPTTDLRLLRRIIRDNRFRGTSAPATIDMWPAVRRGEERNIFPFQQEADVMFNSSLIYELLVLKGYALPLLSAITKDMPQYSEARRLIEFLSYFLQIPADDIPPNSILREFLGGSCFQ